MWKAEGNKTSQRHDVKAVELYQSLHDGPQKLPLNEERKRDRAKPEAAALEQPTGHITPSESREGTRARQTRTAARSCRTAGSCHKQNMGFTPKLGGGTASVPGPGCSPNTPGTTASTAGRHYSSSLRSSGPAAGGGRRPPFPGTGPAHSRAKPPPGLPVSHHPARLPTSCSKGLGAKSGISAAPAAHQLLSRDAPASGRSIRRRARSPPQAPAAAP